VRIAQVHLMLRDHGPGFGSAAIRKSPSRPPQFWLIWWVLCLNVSALKPSSGCPISLPPKISCSSRHRYHRHGLADDDRRSACQHVDEFVPPPKPAIAMPVAMPR
jgi:hypothetical protein